MAGKKPVVRAARKGATGTPARTKRTKGAARFTEDERKAMRERARELKAARARGESEEGDVLAKIAEMDAPDRAMGERIHVIVRAAAPALTPRLWYGMPAYARDGNVVCFFQAARKFRTRYATFAFSDKAMLDDGPMWSTGFALKELTAEVEKKIGALVKKAVR